MKLHAKRIFLNSIIVILGLTALTLTFKMRRREAFHIMLKQTQYSYLKLSAHQRLGYYIYMLRLTENF